MENQHRKIKGYRELSQEEIDLMNRIKEFEPKLDSLVGDLLSHNTDNCSGDPCDIDTSKLDPFDHRWISIGRTHLQQGLMALTRAVAKPDFS